MVRVLAAADQPSISIGSSNRPLSQPSSFENRQSKINYFAHGFRFIDRPWFLAGTAVPDWLSAVDRRVRMRPARVEPVAGEGTLDAEVAAGVLQHLHDDEWFHRTAAFYEVTGAATRLIRESIGEQGHRSSFLGHILTELLIDAVLIEVAPGRLEDYYDALESVDASLVEECINRLARRSTDRLAEFIGLFRRERFLFDYLKPARLLYRLNQVMRRIKLKTLPDRMQQAIIQITPIVAGRIDELLPAERLTTSPTPSAGEQPQTTVS